VRELCLILLMFAVAGMPGALQNVTLEEHLAKLTGEGAIDCGTFATHHNGTAMPPRAGTKASSRAESMHESLACARDAVRNHKAFRLVQRGPTMDSEAASGLVGRVSGATEWFDYNSTPCGRPGCDSRFSTRPCSVNDVVVIHEPDGRHLFRCLRNR